VIAAKVFTNLADGGFGFLREGETEKSTGIIMVVWSELMSVERSKSLSKMEVTPAISGGAESEISQSRTTLASDMSLSIKRAVIKD